MQSSHPAWGPPLLRLFADEPPDDSPESRKPSPAWTLSRFFREYYVPQRRDRLSPLSLAEKRTAIRRWIELTGDPPLRAIDNLVCARFIEAAAQLPGREPGSAVSPNTVRKWITELQTVLKLAGPQSADNRGAAAPEGLFGTDRRGWPRPAPWFEKPAPGPKRPFVAITLAQLRVFIADGAPHARNPRLAGVTPAEWWERLYRLLHNTDLRIGTAVKLRRSWMRERDGAAWLDIPGAAYKQGKPKLIPLNTAALAVIASMPPGDRVFEWPLSAKTLHCERRRLLAAARLPQNLGFHAVRRGGGTWLFRQSPEAAQTQLGHTDAKVTKEYYADPDSHGPALVAIVRPYMERLPQP